MIFYSDSLPIIIKFAQLLAKGLAAQVALLG
jgi:hypothetical protein